VCLIAVVLVFVFGGKGLAREWDGIHYILQVFIFGSLGSPGDDLVKYLPLNEGILVGQITRLLEKLGDLTRVLLIHLT
jgi:hypothetical protein